MITKIYFETFASGMKARLDPAYRQVNKVQKQRNVTLTQKKEMENNQSAFTSLAKIRKALRTDTDNSDLNL